MLCHNFFILCPFSFLLPSSHSVCWRDNWVWLLLEGCWFLFCYGAKKPDQDDFQVQEKYLGPSMNQTWFHLSRSLINSFDSAVTAAHVDVSRWDRHCYLGSCSLQSRTEANAYLLGYFLQSPPWNSWNAKLTQVLLSDPAATCCFIIRALRRRHNKRSQSWPHLSKWCYRKWLWCWGRVEEWSMQVQCSGRSHLLVKHALEPEILGEEL